MCGQIGHLTISSILKAFHFSDLCTMPSSSDIFLPLRLLFRKDLCTCIHDVIINDKLGKHRAFTGMYVIFVIQAGFQAIIIQLTLDASQKERTESGI